MSSSVAAYMHIPTTVRTWRVGAGTLPCAATVISVGHTEGKTARRGRRRRQQQRARGARDGWAEQRPLARSLLRLRHAPARKRGCRRRSRAARLAARAADSPPPRRDGRSRGRPVARATDGRSSDRWCGPAVAAPSAPRAPVRCAPARAPMAKSRRLSRRGRDLGDVGERAHDVVGDARPQPRRGDDDGEEHHGGEERPGAAWARSSFR